MRDQAAVTAVQTEMPGVPLPAASAPERTSVARPERQALLADRLVRDRDAPLGQQGV